MNGLSEKIYLELVPPSLEDPASYQERMLRELREKWGEVKFSLTVLKKLYPMCRRADWKITVTLVWDGVQWVAADLEAGDTVQQHYGICADLGSTTVVTQMVNCYTGEVVAECSVYSHQILFGEDILTRIFYSKDQPEHLEEIRKATVDTFCEVLKELEKKTGISSESCCCMVIAGNAAMIHFLIGMDAFCVFSAPYALRADRPGFFTGKELKLPIGGMVYCYPAKANYLGGDIISGLVATKFAENEELSVFLDIGTNGELVVGNREFMLCGAGAAGPALEGGVVRTGMRAASGAVSAVLIRHGAVEVTTIGDESPKGICGSGIVDMIAELFLNGWIDIRGKYRPEITDKIVLREHEYAVEYAPGLFFFQYDIDEFLKTKAAAYTMVEYMLNLVGIPMEDVKKFYVAGAFGTHVSKESAVTIGMYPDLSREKIIPAGNSSLAGTRSLLLDRSLLERVLQMLEQMVYVQFGAVDDFLHIMVGATALPHTDLRRYPSVRKKLEERGIINLDGEGER